MGGAPIPSGLGALPVAESREKKDQQAFKQKNLS
jgi:hypothetical protein